MLVITGPTGNVGAELTELLIRQPAPPPFRIAAHHPEKIRAAYGPEVPCVPFDYDDRATWGPVLNGIRMLFLLFPLPHPRTVETRMKPLITAAVRAGCQHIIYITVPGADRSRLVPHHHVENHIRASGVNYTFLRASYFMQNLCRRISTHGVDIAERQEIFIPAGKALTTFIDSRDVANVALKVIEAPEDHLNRAYVLTGAERLDFYRVAEIFSEVMGRPIRYTSPSFPQFWYRLWRRGVKWDVILFMTIVYTLTVTGQNAPLTDDLPRLLGRPATSMRQFVKDYLWRWEQRAWT
jgi:uncharacterized protein YbjT (DUF2867 family)